MQTILSSYAMKDDAPLNNLALKTVGKMEYCSFDATAHLEYAGTPKVHSMEDLGFSKETGVSAVAVSQPFKLFSNQAIQRFRHEIFSSQVQNNFEFSSNIAPCQLRGYASK